MSNKVIIIAEAGVNHNGDIEFAKKLIEKAADSGADFVKFQTFIAENVISSNAKKADYQIKNTGSNETQLQMVKKLELKFDDFIVLKKHAELNNIKFLSTPFDLESIIFLKDLGLNIFKIPSGEITNLPYLKLLGSFNLEIILSTGMASISEINSALNVLVNSGTELSKIKILHCNTEYPTKMTDVNLLAMNHIKEEFGVDVGYSDHTEGIEVSIAAVALGAKIIEKHFTLDKSMDGPDHIASLNPNELTQLVNSIRNVEMAISGSGLKEPSETEIRNIAIVRKSIHYKRDLVKGHILEFDDLVILRPGSGVSSMELGNVLGKELNVNVESNQLFNFNDLK
jgi:N,N'-diacetyllegionaminate synthase